MEGCIMAKKKKTNFEHEYFMSDNPAKSFAGDRHKSRKKKKKDNTASKRIGIALAIIQLLASIVLMVSLFVLDMLSFKYLGIIGGLLLVMFLIILVGQLLSRNKAIFGKVVSVLLSVVFIFGAYYVFKMNSTVENITTASNTKYDSVVVAVLATDPAESIQDAADYNFGVQYALKGEEIEETVDVINSELGSEILTTDCGSVLEQAVALHNGEVQAIIYNEAYAGILEEEIEDYANAVKIIYSHEIESEDEKLAEEVVIEDNTFAVYISGIDVYGKIGTTSRSDVNIIAVVNTDSHQILLITTPRDYYVPIPGVSGGVRDKLTHAGIYGVSASMATLEELYDMNLDFYARVNFTSLIKMVDALGGVDVYSNQSFTTMHGSVQITEGYNHLNGEQALCFARERYNVEGGDFQRGKNQQEVIKAMIKKAISPAILTGANEILNSVSGNVDTNMSTDFIRELIKDQLDTGASWSMKSVAATGTGDKQTCYSIPSSYVYVAWPDEDSVEEIKTLIEAVENGEILEGSDTTE